MAKARAGQITCARMQPIPILLYHSVSASPSAAIAPFSVSPDVFSSHLDAIVESHRTPLTVSEYAAGLGTGTLPDRPVVITFDDGYSDFHEHALPALARRGLPSTLYVTTGFLEGGTPQVPARPPDPMLHWSQLAELVAAGTEIGAHGHRHFQLDTLSVPGARDEITRCKVLLEDAIGAEVQTFAYPHGYSSPTVRSLTRSAGYRSAAGVKNAFSRADDDLFSLARLTVGKTTDEATLRDWLAGVGAPAAPAREHASTRLWRGLRRSRSLVTRRPGCAF